MTHATTPTAQPTIPPVVQACLTRARLALANGDAPGAVESAAAAAITDIQQHRQAFLKDAGASRELCSLYASAASLAGIGVASLRPRPLPRPLRLAYVLGSVIAGQAASANVVRFLRLHDRARVEPSLIVVEEMTRRTPPTAFLTLPDAPSETLGGELLAEARSLARVEVVPASGHFIHGAREAVRIARSWSPDAVVFVGSPASPIQSLMAHARVAPVQFNMNIGVPLVIPGIDHVIYNNPDRHRDDAAELLSWGLHSSTVETSGADVSAGLTGGIADRASLGVPPGGVLLASASNRLAARMLAGKFARDLALCMASDARLWWVGIGPGPVGEIRSAMEALGGPDVRRRLVFVGPQSDIRPVVRAADMFLNEYPEGGGNTVLEAMGCGVPVVAMAAGPRHAERIGAVLVGEAAIPEHNVGAYWDMVRRLAGSPSERAALGRSLRARALERFDYPVICRSYERIYLEACAG